jgi:hypothetical protein
MKQRWNELIHSIDIPFDPLHEKTNQDNLVSALINLILLIGFLGLILLGILRGITSVIFLTALFFVIITLLARIAVQRGYSQIVSFLFLGFAWIFLTAMILFFENGLRAPVYIGLQLFLVVYAGLLHGRKAVIVISALSIGISGLVASMELQGIFLTEPKIPEVQFAIIALSIFIIATGFLITKTLENIQLSISMYREESKIRYA